MQEGCEPIPALRASGFHTAGNRAYVRYQHEFLVQRKLVRLEIFSG